MVHACSELGLRVRWARRFQLLSRRVVRDRPHRVASQVRTPGASRAAARRAWPSNLLVRLRGTPSSIVNGRRKPPMKRQSPDIAVGYGLRPALGLLRRDTRLPSKRSAVTTSRIPYLADSPIESASRSTAPRRRRLGFSPDRDHRLSPAGSTASCEAPCRREGRPRPAKLPPHHSKCLANADARGPTCCLSVHCAQYRSAVIRQIVKVAGEARRVGEAVAIAGQASLHGIAPHAPSDGRPEGDGVDCRIVCPIPTGTSLPRWEALLRPHQLQAIEKFAERCGMRASIMLQ